MANTPSPTNLFAVEQVRITADGRVLRNHGDIVKMLLEKHFSMDLESIADNKAQSFASDMNEALLAWPFEAGKPAAARNRKPATKPPEGAAEVPAPVTPPPAETPVTPPSVTPPPVTPPPVTPPPVLPPPPIPTPPPVTTPTPVSPPVAGIPSIPPTGAFAGDEAPL